MKKSNLTRCTFGSQEKNQHLSNISNDDNMINTADYHAVISTLRNFFLEKEFIEVPVQSRLSILAACEDPSTVASFNYNDSIWPLPQTGQMWLEMEILANPNVKGYFCISTSYRAEKNIIPGRHKTIFPMFEFETHGGLDVLIDLQKELMNYCGFHNITQGDYLDIAKKYNVAEISHKEEEKISRDYSETFLLKNFPIYTHPFWNMKINNGTANKVDLIAYGQETIGSAERSVDKKEMRDMFMNISDGNYAKTIFNLFGKERVLKELENFLSLDLFKRCGGGIGVTRMIRAFKLHNLI